jgi:hypothetical protein
MFSNPRVSLSFSAEDWARWVRERGWDVPSADRKPAVIQCPEPPELFDFDRYFNTQGWWDRVQDPEARKL